MQRPDRWAEAMQVYRGQADWERPYRCAEAMQVCRSYAGVQKLGRCAEATHVCRGQADGRWPGSSSLGCNLPDPSPRVSFGQVDQSQFPGL